MSCLGLAPAAGWMQISCVLSFWAQDELGMRFAWWITRTSEALTHITYFHIPLIVSSHLANPKAFQVFKMHQRTSLVVQWLKLCASDAGGPCSIPGQETRSHVPQLRHGVAKYVFKCTKLFSASKSLHISSPLLNMVFPDT